MKHYYIVAAAGVGKRMELDYPKQFLEYHGKPIFVWVLEVINRNANVDGIIIVTKDEYIDEVDSYCKKFDIKKTTKIVSGGKERQDSVYNAMQYIPENSIVGIQDGVRPFIKDEYITKAYALLESDEELDGVVVGVKAKDTMKIVSNDNTIIDTPPRETIFSAQTPQVFRTNILKKAYDYAKSKNIVGTDDSSLVEKIGNKVKIIPGSYENIKITTPEDLKYLQ